MQTWTPSYLVDGARTIGKIECREVYDDRNGSGYVFGAWWYRDGESSHAVGRDFDSFIEARDWIEEYELSQGTTAAPPKPVINRTAFILGYLGALILGGLLSILWIQI